MTSTELKAKVYDLLAEYENAQRFMQQKQNEINEINKLISEAVATEQKEAEKVLSKLAKKQPKA